jgi:hypothetical protein
MHSVARQILDLDREERAGPDVERQPDGAYVPLPETFHQSFREMQTGGGRGNRVCARGEDVCVPAASPGSTLRSLRI